MKPKVEQDTEGDDVMNSKLPKVVLVCRLPVHNL